MSEDVCPRFFEDGGNLETTIYRTDQYSGYSPRDRGLCCNYCGSLHPDIFMSQIRDGAQLDVTDKDYKAYLGNSKFYFQHLSTEQQREFVEWVNAKAVNLGWPGHFTVLPFFMGRAD